MACTHSQLQSTGSMLTVALARPPARPPARRLHFGTAEQQLVDCVSGNTCSGGQSDVALSYVSSRKNIIEARYPYR